MDIDNFFKIEKSVKFNSKSKPIPEEFKNWKEPQKFFNWIRQESNTGSLKLDIDSDINKVVDEIKKAETLAIPHRTHDSNGWRSIVLHGLSSIMTGPPHDYISTGIVPIDAVEGWTDVSKFFPETLIWIKKYIPFKVFSRIRIMILDPGGYILPHKDLEKSFLGGGINVAFTNPSGVEFALEDNGLVPWAPGDIRLINIGKLHSVRNLSNETRIHMLVYPLDIAGWNDYGMSLVCKSYEKMKKDSNDTAGN